MPRVAGQIDKAKNAAILDAASEVLAERGLSAPVEAIARRAGVSKQTVYNHYGSRAELLRAMVTRRVEAITAPLARVSAEAEPMARLEAILAAFAWALIDTLCSQRNCAVMRVTIGEAAEQRELAREVFEAGPMVTRARLAAFLAAEAAAGRLAVDNPRQAAEIFAGMAIGQRQLRTLMGLPGELDEAGVLALCAEIARRFVRAYAP